MFIVQTMAVQNGLRVVRQWPAWRWRHKRMMLWRMLSTMSKIILQARGWSEMPVTWTYVTCPAQSSRLRPIPVTFMTSTFGRLTTLFTSWNPMDSPLSSNIDPTLIARHDGQDSGSASPLLCPSLPLSPAPTPTSRSQKAPARRTLFKKRQPRAWKNV